MLRPACVLFFLLSILTGIIYPVLVMGIGKIFFAEQIAGSLIEKDGKIIGSALIGQNFNEPKYFWGRPSETGNTPYNAQASGGSNLGPLNPVLQENVTANKTNLWGHATSTTLPYNPLSSGGSELGPLNPKLLNEVKERVNLLRQTNAQAQQVIPVELVTASASGLDPHISPAAAFYQAPRVATARGLSVESINQLIQAHIEGRQWGIFGEPRINVLQLNLTLDQHF